MIELIITIGVVSVLINIFFMFYIFKFNARLSTWADDIYLSINKSNDCSHNHMNNTIKDIKALTGLTTAIHIETGQLLSKLDKISQSKKEKPSLKITKTKKATKKATAKKAKVARRRPTG